MGAAPGHGGGDEHLEIELKLHVPDEAFDDVERAMREGDTAREIRLRAEYHDTDDWALASCGLTWRMRREGDRWVQTLKGRMPAASDDMARVEHDVDVTDRASGHPLPPLDASLHDGAAGARLRAVLDDVHARGDAIEVQFTTDVLRIERQAANDHGTVLLALDHGTIAAGDLRLPVSELEIELVDGTAAAVVEEAERLASRFGLARDTVNKARRGRALADQWRARATPT
ncbi:MAG: CYTH domain-containing protein [Ilumatobacteraceae bacterium]